MPTSTFVSGSTITKSWQKSLLMVGIQMTPYTVHHTDLRIFAVQQLLEAGVDANAAASWTTKVAKGSWRPVK
jgi:hypothetical protein